MNEAIETIMIKKMVTLTPENSLEDARIIFDEEHFHHIPVVKDGILAGIISTFDLLHAQKPISEYKNIPLSEVMTTKVAALHPTDKIGAASIVLLQNKFHAVPVVDEDRRLVGILTTFDLLKYQYEQAYPGDDFPFA